MNLNRDFATDTPCMLKLFGECEETAINSHTISAVNLRLISEKSHIRKFQFFPYVENIEETVTISNSSVNRASAFKGFCAKHDNALFGAIDKSAFDLNENTLATYAFRSYCQEIWLKMRNVSTLSSVRSFSLQEGKSEAPEPLQGIVLGSKLAIRDLSIQAKTAKEVMECRRSNVFRYMGLQLNERLPFAYLAPLNFELFPEYNLEEKEPYEITLSALCGCIPNDTGTLFMLCWVKGYEKQLNPLLRRLELARNALPEFLFQFGAEHFENFFLTPSWVDGWDSETIRKVTDVFRRTVFAPTPNLNWRPFAGTFSLPQTNVRLTTNSTKIKMWYRERM